MKNIAPIAPDTMRILEGISDLQLAWLSGYCWARSCYASSPTKEIPVTHAQSTQDTENTSKIQSTAATELPTITIISASQTGNARGVANKLNDRLMQAGINVKHHNAKDYKTRNITNEKLLIIVTSTQGDGEPPEEGVMLHKFLSGKKAPRLDLQFAVLGLGDSSYPNFCKAGRDIDRILSELGGKRILERVDADLDFSATATQWIEDVVSALSNFSAISSPNTPSASPMHSSSQNRYDKSNPFGATLLSKQKITGRGSQKDVRHIELDLTGSGIEYEPGDALGVWFENDSVLVDELLSYTGLSGDEVVSIPKGKIPLRQALISHLELKNTSAFVKAYAAHASLHIDSIQSYVNIPLVDIVHKYPCKIEAQTLVDLLRPIAPRLYSIASASSEVGEEVHLCVGVVRFEYEGRARSGAASSWLADRVNEDDIVQVFVERNENFRLPADDVPIIMIGSGTGIAPFRAFVQQRVASDAKGKNWLIFGNQHFSDDFLYQVEWQRHAKDGFLHKCDFAWSRDQEEKIYVQHKILERGDTIWQWLQDGAAIYVCGDVRMAKDVEKALLEVISKYQSSDEAEEYLNSLREERRYQRDVY